VLEMRLQFLGLIGGVYLPIAVAGLMTLRRRLFALKVGLAYALLGTIFCVVMAYKTWLGIGFDFGGIYRDPLLTHAIFILLALMGVIEVFLYAAALVAYRANREQIRQAERLQRPAGPSVKDGR